MKVKEKKIKFGDLEQGAVFLDEDGCACIKITPVLDPDEEGVLLSGVDLIEGIALPFDDDLMVTPKTESTILLN